MRVYKVVLPLLAYSFFATDKGNNAEELTKDVTADGGVLVVNSDTCITLTFEHGQYTVPIGYTLIIDGGSSKLISNDKFKEDFVSASKVNDGIDLNGVLERISALETALASSTKKTSTKKSSSTESHESA